MTLREVKRQTLIHLFEWFKEDRGVHHASVWDLITEMGEDPIDITKQLENERLIKQRMASRSNVNTKISVRGILEVDPSHFDEFRDKLLISLMQSEDHRVLLLASLGFEEKDLELGRYIADYMMDCGLAKVQFNRRDGIVTLSPRGREYYEDNQARFLNM